ncbi:MAG: hypothetical protein ACU0CI_05205 [Shimia sp.]
MSATWEDGLEELQQLAENRRWSFDDADILPPADCDFAPLKAQMTERNAPLKNPMSAITKRAELSEEFEGRPELLTLHGLLIALLRHDNPPPKAALLFQRLWAEEGAWLIDALDLRWKVSAVATFRDHGTTEAQRKVGLALAVFFNLMKLYETERMFSDKAPGEPWPLRNRQTVPMAMEMFPFAIRTGDLDRNLILYLWEECDAADPVIRPLALHLMEGFNADHRNIFRRFKRLRARIDRQAQD